MGRVSRPMKLVTLRIDEEEKARLEQLAERGDVTLSRAFREGAALYLSDLREKAHRAQGGEATFVGLRRRQDGTPAQARSEPTKRERARIRRLRHALQDQGLGSIRESLQRGEPARILLAAVGQWLSLVGWLYAANDGEAGWDWFIRDYCMGYSNSDDAKVLRRQIRGALFRSTTVDLEELLRVLEEACERFLGDVERHALVRRAVLPAWAVVEKGWGVED
jgi:hypothetical protein